MDEILFERIHRYLAGQMPDEEKRAFVQEMNTNPTLLEAVEIQQQIKD